LKALVRIDTDAHRVAKIAAALQGLTLEQWLNRAIQDRAEQEVQPAPPVANGEKAREQ
jgi:predicted HicB family RNase H-like nuclease